MGSLQTPCYNVQHDLHSLPVTELCIEPFSLRVSRCKEGLRQLSLLGSCVATYEWKLLVRMFVWQPVSAHSENLLCKSWVYLLPEDGSKLEHILHCVYFSMEAYTFKCVAVSAVFQIKHFPINLSFNH